jgi:hypothetical protein
LTGKKILWNWEASEIKEKKKFSISTTHGAETHVLTAVLATIDVVSFRKCDSHNHKVGDAIS